MISAAHEPADSTRCSGFEGNLVRSISCLCCCCGNRSVAQSDRAPLRPRFGHGQEQHKREQELGGGTFVNVFGERLGLGLGTCVPFSSPAES